MHVDSALLDEEASQIAEHLQSCDECQARVSALGSETALIARTIQADDPTPVVIPTFKRPTSLRSFALANVATGLVLWLVQFLWKTLFGELVVNGASWATSIYLPDFYELAVTTALYYLQEGTAMLDAYLGFIVVSLVTLTVLSILLVYRRNQALCLMSLMAVILVVPEPANALDVRRSEGAVTVSEAETIDDTLIVVADVILVEGDVKGDLIAAGRRIDIYGSVDGNVFSAGESITIRGKVGGVLFTAGESVDLDGAQVGGDFWAAGEKLLVGNNARIGRNAIMAGERPSMRGSVGKDLFGFGETIEIDGNLGGNLEVYGETVRLQSETNISGSARLHLPGEDSLERASGAQVQGGVEFMDLPDEFNRNRYATLEFYMWQIARLVSAVLVGFVLLWMIPGLRNVSIDGAVGGLKSAGIGFAALILAPVAAALIGVTLIGLPFSVLTILAWVIAIYLAKIMVGIYVGGVILGDSERSHNNFLVVLVGLTAVIFAINLPAIGGLISFLATIIGIGLVVQTALRSFSGRNGAQAGA
jgi:cytoskeletal protein CcmA (bactofilin family)